MPDSNLAAANQNGSTDSIANAYKTLSRVANPMGALRNLFSETQIGQVLNVVQQNGGDARQAFYNLAQQRGVDPNSILNQLR